MNLDDYISNLLSLFITLVIDITIPIITYEFIPDSDDNRIKNILLALTMLVGNIIIAYFATIITFVDFTDKARFSPIIPAVAVFILLSVAEYIIRNNVLRNSSHSIVRVSTSPADYKELILHAEENAKQIRLIPKRIHVMFKSREFISYLAERRFGVGSPYQKPYIDEHTARSFALMQALGEGMCMYEIHNKRSLIEYVTKRTHPGVDDIEVKYIREMLIEWKRVLTQYPNNYFVRLTDELISMKYEIIDENKVVMHESAGKNSSDRLNAIFIESSEIAQKIGKDFSKIWDAVPPEECTTQFVCDWIDNNLLSVL